MPSNLRRAVRSFVASPIKEEKSYRQIDEPSLALDLAAMLERNSLHAKSQGLPAIGSKLLNPHGLEFVVEGHVHVPTANTIQSWRDGKGNAPTDLYPSIIPQNLSPKLMDFIETVDRCTTKTLLVLDTMPYQRKDSGVPGGHWIDTLGNTGANLLFIDAASIHETHFAHEIGHLWIQYVDQAEDERVLEDASDPARINQLSFVQSFVLDFRVNEIIEAHGFDISVIREDQDQAIASLGRAIGAGYRPENKREEVFMALTLATHLVESREDKLLANPTDTLARVSQLNPKFLELANKFAEAIKKCGFRDKESIRASIDACLSIAFLHTGDGIDLDHDLVIPPAQEPDFDKFPQWIEGASALFKCDVGRLMAREKIPNESNWILSPGTANTTSVSFKLPSGETLGTWTLDYPYPNSPNADRRREINEINRQNRERQMKQTKQATSPLDNMPGQPRRFYMAGTGRFLTRVREEEWLSGESAYGYAMDNPLTYVDPSGNAPQRKPKPIKAKFCWRPVHFGQVDTGLDHWFIIVPGCGSMGYGPEGFIPDYPGNSDNLPIDRVHCREFNLSPDQVKCLCNLKHEFQLLQQYGSTACLANRQADNFCRSWGKGTFSVIPHDCQNFVQTILNHCGVSAPDVQVPFPKVSPFQKNA